MVGAQESMGGGRVWPECWMRAVGSSREKGREREREVERKEGREEGTCRCFSEVLGVDQGKAASIWM